MLASYHLEPFALCDTECSHAIIVSTVCIRIDVLFITGGQIRAARGFLRWSAEELAKQAKLGRLTVTRAESVEGKPSITEANLEAIRRALEAAGIEFISENGGGSGVRLRKPAERSGE